MIPRLRASASFRVALAISCVLAMRFIGPVLGRADDKPIEGIGPVGKIEKVEGKFEFTEGPLWTGDALYFSDIPKQRIYRLADGGKPQVFVEDSKHANGLFA